MSFLLMAHLAHNQIIQMFVFVWQNLLVKVTITHAKEYGLVNLRKDWIIKGGRSIENTGLRHISG